MNPQVEKALEQIDKIQEKFPDSPLKAGDMEEDLLAFLTLVREAQECRNDFIELFTKMIHGETEAPEWLLAYCMRDLRWEEIKVIAQSEARRGNPLTLDHAAEVSEAFETEWFGEKLFRRYGRKD